MMQGIIELQGCRIGPLRCGDGWHEVGRVSEGDSGLQIGFPCVFQRIATGQNTKLRLPFPAVWCKSGWTQRLVQELLLSRPQLAML